MDIKQITLNKTEMYHMKHCTHLKGNRKNEHQTNHTEQNRNLPCEALHLLKEYKIASTKDELS